MLQPRECESVAVVAVPAVPGGMCCDVSLQEATGQVLIWILLTRPGFDELLIMLSNTGTWLLLMREDSARWNCWWRIKIVNEWRKMMRKVEKCEIRTGRQRLVKWMLRQGLMIEEKVGEVDVEARTTYRGEGGWRHMLPKKKRIWWWMQCFVLSPWYQYDIIGMWCEWVQRGLIWWAVLLVKKVNAVSGDSTQIFSDFHVWWLYAYLVSWMYSFPDQLACLVRGYRGLTDGEVGEKVM